MGLPIHKYLLPLFFFVSTALIGQNELGNPYIKNYSPKDYNGASTIWDITQDEKGLMYFGTSNGIMQYDGLNWNTIGIPNNTTVRSLDIDDKGTVYVGVKNDFGRLAEDDKGQLYYESISETLPEELQDFSDVWNIYVTKDGVFFLTFRRIYLYRNDKIEAFEYDDITAHLGFYVNDQMYLILLKKGIHVFNGESFEPVPGGDYFVNQTIFGILPYDKNHVVVVSRKLGLVLLNTKTGEIQDFAEDLNPELQQSNLYHAAVAENGDYVLASLSDGIFVINREGNLAMHLTQMNGLQNDNVKYVFKDKYGGLWAGTAVGISYIDLNLPLTYLNNENGIRGFTRSIIRYKGTIYIATGNGVFYLDAQEVDHTKKFKQISGEDSQFWNFLNVDDRLFVAASKGFYELIKSPENGHQLKRHFSFDSEAVFDMVHSRKYPNRVYIAIKSGIGIVFLDESGAPTRVHHFKNREIESDHITEDKDGNLWVSTAFDYTVKVYHSSLIEEDGFPLTFKKYNSLDQKLSPEQIINLDNEIYLTSSEGLLKAVEGDTLELVQPFNFNVEMDGKVISRLYKDHNGNLWLHFHKGKETGQYLAINKGGNNYTIKDDPFTRINEKLSHSWLSYTEQSGITWFIGGEGIVRYDFNRDEGERKTYNVNIRKVTLHSDSIIAYGNNLLKNIDNFTFAFNNNATAFTFSAASYGNEQENQYQYFLEGYDEEWSDWTTMSTKEYNYLPENTYVFRVRAKNIYNQISKEDQFTFVVLPPWYRETWAYIIYGVLFLVLIYIIIRIATYRLKQSKIQLEKIVEERTKDILIEKEKVEHQKHLLEEVHEELAERNKDVMDSIKYAQRIQSSILPPLDKLKDNFKESFVLYKPRDIVSGDFYWYEKVGDYFIMACADCTGHGVPGAFMSMIGTTLLTKIVEMEKVEHCEDALTELDVELQRTLQQTYIDDEREVIMDGMDISLIAVSSEKGECHYSGAYRPLYLSRNGEIIVYDSNRCSIGGGLTKDKTFEGKTISIQKGDQLYMFTDGVTDQFGGEKNKKFKRDRLKNLLINIADKSMSQQKELINDTFEEWRGDNEQIDDVLITGIRIT